MAKSRAFTRGCRTIVSTVIERAERDRAVPHGARTQHACGNPRLDDKPGSLRLYRPTRKTGRPRGDDGDARAYGASARSTRSASSPIVFVLARSSSPNRIPNSSSIPKMMLMFASESQPTTSAGSVSGVRTMSSSPRSPRTTRSIPSSVGDRLGPGSDELTVDDPPFVDVVLPGLGARVVRAERETEPFKDVLDHAVLGSRDERPAQPGDTALERERAQSREHLVLDRPPDDAAAHHPRVDIRRARFVVSDQHRDETVVAELVSQPQIHRDRARVVHELAELVGAVAASRDVELIRLAHELRDPRKVQLVERSDERLH